MATPLRFPFWSKILQSVALLVAICFSLGATDAGSRSNNLSHKLMCQCGCAQLLGECDHVGCPDRAKELDKLNAAVAAGTSDEDIFNSFVAEYGATVLAAPTTHGFDLVAWVAPFAVFGAALMGTILLIKRWGGVRGRAQAAVATADIADPAERERMERIRRETGSDGGY